MSLSKAITISEKGLSFDIVRRSNLFPPLDILNTFFQCGIDDAASEITIQWPPFSLTAIEYEQFVEHWRKNVRQVRIDSLTHNHYSSWFSDVAMRSNH